MRISNLKKRFVCLFLVFTLSFQSCSVYKKTAVTLNEAEKANLKTLVITTDNTKHRYSRIIKINDSYYGEVKAKGKIETILLSEEEIKSIRILDKTSSAIGNIAIVLVSVGGIYLIVSLIELANWASN